MGTIFCPEIPKLFEYKKGSDLWNLPEQGPRTAYAYISRFPKLIAFIEKHEGEIQSDLWGLLYGYPLDEVHQSTYAHKRWEKTQDQVRRSKDSSGKRGLNQSPSNLPER